MRRRQFIKLIGGAAAWPFAVGAQQPTGMRHIAVLMGYPEGDQEGQTFAAAFRDELQKLGWIEGRTIRIDTRWASPRDPELRERLAKEIIALHPHLILSHGTPVTATLLQQTRTIPIIFVNVADPVGSGFVASFNRPGGNVTGLTNIEPTMASKWLEMIKEIAPQRRSAAGRTDRFPIRVLSNSFSAKS
jgi:putative tryptophan/tyrosine transport system substrate-binding protein